ncbi:MAG: hypothetical protein ACON42_04525 [Flavobacteriaceae bacterium]
MFSKGQLIFGILFFISFTAVIVYMYAIDRKKQPTYFRGSYKILLGFLVAFLILLGMKFLTH